MGALSLGQGEEDPGPFSKLAFDLKCPAMCLDEMLNNGQAQAGPAQLPEAGLIHPIEALGNPGKVPGGDTDARIFHGDFDEITVMVKSHHFA